MFPKKKHAHLYLKRKGFRKFRWQILETHGQFNSAFAIITHIFWELFINTRSTESFSNDTRQTSRKSILNRLCYTKYYGSAIKKKKNNNNELNTKNKTTKTKTCR